jgi:hypothetical protein
VAIAATRREQKFGETLSTRSVIAAGVGLGVLALATIESAVRFAVWLVLPTRDLTASAPVQLLADGIQRLTRVSDESARPLHAAWLVLGLLMLAGVLGLRQASSASLPNPPQRALKRATYLQAGFVGEFALLVATQTLFGRAVGITTLFGLDESYAPLIQSVATLFSFCVLVAVSFHVYRAAQVHGAAGALESTSLKPIAMTAEQHWSRLRDAGVRAGLVPRPVEPADDSPIRWVSFVAREQHLPVSWQPMNLAA